MGTIEAGLIGNAMQKIAEEEAVKNDESQFDSEGNKTTLGGGANFAKDNETVKSVNESQNLNDVVNIDSDQAERIRKINEDSARLRAKNIEKGYTKKPKPKHEINNDNEEELKTGLHNREADDRRTDRRNETIEVLDMDKAKLQYQDSLAAYAQTEYKHRTTMQGIQKFFGNKFLGKAEDHADVKGDFNRLKDDLAVYRDAWIRDIQNDEKSTKESRQTRIEEMMTFFNHKAVIDLYDARTGAKASVLFHGDKNGKDITLSEKERKTPHAEREKKEISENDGKEKKNIRDLICTPFKMGWAGLEKIEQTYNKLPLTAKLAASAAILLSGSWALIAGKRFIGAAATAVGSSKGLDALHQRSMKKASDAENKAFLSGEGKENKKEADFEKLRALLGEKIDQVDEKMNKHKIASLFNKFAGVGIGVLIGSGAFSKMLGASVAHAGEYWQHGKEAVSGAVASATHESGAWSINAFEHSHSLGTMENPNAQNWSTNAYDHAQAVQAEGGKTWSTNAFEHSQNIQNQDAKGWSTNAFEHSQAIPPENIPSKDAFESLTIAKGSSIEGTLNKFMEANHPEIKNHGAVAHKMYTAYMKDYIETHQDELTKSGKLAEYKEMLATGRVNIQPGAELKIVEINGQPVLTEIKGDIKMLHGGILHMDGTGKLPEIPDAKLPDVSVGKLVENYHDNLTPENIISGNEPLPAPENTTSLINDAIEQHKQEEIINSHQEIISSQESFKYAHNDYAKAIDKIMSGHTTESNISSQHDAMSSAETVMNQSAEYIKNTTEYRSDLRKLTDSIYETFKSGDKNLLLENQNVEYDRAIADNEIGSKLKDFREISSNVIKNNVKYYNGNYVPTLNPSDGETVKHYMQRVILRTIESKYGILRG